MGWAGRTTYLAAMHERKMMELYCADLVWLIAKKDYRNLRQPSDVYNNQQRTDTRSAKQIVDGLLKRLGGE
jgi:hypothetical protein